MIDENAVNEAESDPNSEPSDDTGEEDTGSLFQTGPDQGSGYEPPSDESDSDERLYANKYKSVEELEKGYENVLKKMQERGNSLDDDTLRNLANERGILSQPPENYDIETAMQEAGIDPDDSEEAAEKYEEFANELREQGFSQDQVNYMMKVGASWVQQQIDRLGPEVDLESETEKLSEVWGDKLDERRGAISKWAQANLPSDVYTKPLAQTAEGMKLLNQLMEGKQGGKPIQQSEREPTVDTIDLDKKINEIMRSDAYRDSTHPEYSAAQKRVYSMIKTMQNNKKR